MKKGLLLITLISALIMITGCEMPVEDPLEEELQEEKPIEEIEAPDNDLEAIEFIVKKNLEATENQDIHGVLQTMHEESPGYDKEAIKIELEDLFKHYDLEYELEILDVRIKNGEAEVDFLQITRAVENEDFDDNKVTGIHIMRQQNGEWRIYDSHIEETEMLD